MAKIDPEVLQQIHAGSSIEVIRDVNGNPIGYKGRFLPHVYDNYMECHKENKFANMEQKLKKEGKNKYAQTPEEAKAFEARKKLQLERKRRAEEALLGAEVAGATRR